MFCGLCLNLHEEVAGILLLQTINWEMQILIKYFSLCEYKILFIFFLEIICFTIAPDCIQTCYIPILQKEGA
jgi:hypothetical protein